MSNIFGLDEEVFPMPPVKMATLEEVATATLEELAPESLKEPSPLRVWHLINEVLPERGIHVYSASEEQMGGNEGLTIPHPIKGAQILLKPRAYESLEHGGPKSHFARGTIGHELGHCILHVHKVRARKKLADMFGVALHRVARRTLKSYEDPEWQAYAIGGCLLAPRAMIMKLSDRSARNVSRVFGISEQLATMHLRRLKML